MPRHPNVRPPPPPPEDSDGGDFVLGETLAEEDGEVEVQWDEATYQGVEVEKGTADTLLTKAQADARYGAITGGTVGYLQIDASSGDVTESLPMPGKGAVVAVARVDNTSSNTGTVEYTGGPNIEWRGRGSASSFSLPTLSSVLFTGAEAPNGDLYWQCADDPFGRIHGFAVGQPAPSFPLMSFVADGAMTLVRVEYVLGSLPSGSPNPTVSVEVNGVSISDTTLSSSPVSDTLSDTLSDGDVVTVTIDLIDPGLRDVRILFRYL